MCLRYQQYICLFKTARMYMSTTLGISLMTSHLTALYLATYKHLLPSPAHTISTGFLTRVLSFFPYHFYTDWHYKIMQISPATQKHRNPDLILSPFPLKHIASSLITFPYLTHAPLYFFNYRILYHPSNASTPILYFILSTLTIFANNLRPI